ncbi:hypothetical protein V8C26DRAFT_405225 [Trichoderma gracile]
MHNASDHWQIDVPLRAPGALNSLTALPNIKSPGPPPRTIPSDVSIRPAAPCHIANSSPVRSSAPFCNLSSSAPKENRGRERAPMTKADKFDVCVNLDETRDAGLGFTLPLTGWTVTRGLAYPNDAASKHLLPRAPQPLSNPPPL